MIVKLKVQIAFLKLLPTVSSFKGDNVNKRTGLWSRGKSVGFSSDVKLDAKYMQPVLIN